MRKFLTFATLASFLFVGGCSSEKGPEYTKSEGDMLRNPPKTLPKQLGDTMKYAAEDSRKKMEASMKDVKSSVPTKK